MKLKMLFIAICCSSLMGFSISPKLDKKVDKTIAKFFETENFQRELLRLSQDEISSLPADFQERLYTLTVEGNKEGYVYIGNAPSKTATFDYMILFDNDYTIKKSKVLIYREEYGGEIGSKRWLKQFNDKSIASETLAYGDNISAISGATISVRSMTNAVNDVLVSLKILIENGTL